MKAVVDEALGDIHGVDAVAFLRGIAEDHFVHGRTRVRKIVDAFEIFADVVGVEHRIFGGLANAGPVGEDVSQGANEHAKIAAEGFNAADGFLALEIESEAATFFFDQDGSWEIRLENPFHGDWAGTGATT